MREELLVLDELSAKRKTVRLLWTVCISIDFHTAAVLARDFSLRDFSGR